VLSKYILFSHTAKQTFIINMSSRIIVRNIPTNVDEKKLKEIFSKFGPVTDVKVCLKGNTHRRFCFIGYKSDNDAKKAKEYFNNTYIQMNKV